MPASTPNTPAANPHLVCMQAAEVHEKNEFRGEPHLHVLANLFDIIIVVVQRRAREIWLTQYSPGWTEQKEIEKPALRTLLTRWRAGQIQRPVFIKLDELNTHFEAMVYQPRPFLESSPDKSGLAASTRAASSVMVLD